ncbi:hypothetical protein QE412_000933 [Microbacterium trichothecenolyticum]|uniref:DUF222 domain-containing protein n=1 Tax=Microbacterium trichothecenolyticum TaxID=69370 RepID=A0ABU0TRR7_MICTR|nr:hypothetical protein [Microbacterium trichothecenolyticum]
MDLPTPFADRLSPTLRVCDAVPWPSDDELDAEAAWAHEMSSGAPLSTVASDPDALLECLDMIAAERHRLAAEEGRLIATVLHDAAVDPTPWVGPDPTLDLAWHDPRARTVAAVRRDRIDLPQPRSPCACASPNRPSARVPPVSRCSTPARPKRPPGSCPRSSPSPLAPCASASTPSRSRRAIGARRVTAGYG